MEAEGEFCFNLCLIRDLSSVGLERGVDNAKVGGSTPSGPTFFEMDHRNLIQDQLTFLFVSSCGFKKFFSEETKVLFKPGVKVS